MLCRRKFEDVWAIIVVILDLMLLVSSPVQLARDKNMPIKCLYLHYLQVVSVLRPALDQHFPEQMGVHIIAEPGRYFAASAFTLAVNIIAKRTISSSDSTSCGPGSISAYQVSDTKEYFFFSLVIFAQLN